MFNFNFRLQKKFNDRNIVNIEELEDVLTVESRYSRDVKKIKKGEIYFCDLSHICGARFYKYKEGAPDYAVTFEFDSRVCNNVDGNIPLVIKYCGNSEFEEMNTGDIIRYVDDSSFEFIPAYVNEENAERMLNRLKKMKKELTKYELFINWTLLYLKDVSEYEKTKYLSVSDEKRKEVYSALKQKIAASREKTGKELDYYIKNIESLIADAGYRYAQFDNKLYDFADVDKTKYLV